VASTLVFSEVADAPAPSPQNIFDSSSDIDLPDNSSHGTVEEFRESYNCNMCATQTPFNDAVELENWWALEGYCVINPLSQLTYLRCANCLCVFHMDCLVEANRMTPDELPQITNDYVCHQCV
jgi:hypothetical protein